MLKTKPLLLLVGLSIAAPLVADDLVESFEAASSDHWVWGKGRGSTGKAEISKEKARTGTSASKVSFEFTEPGWIEFYTYKGAAIQGDAAYISLWATGLKTDEFAATAIRFIDKNGETFQYDFQQLLEAATSPDWKQGVAKVDLTQPKINWGANADGILDKPIRFSGFGLTRKNATTGAFFLDDLKVSENEIVAELK